MSKQLTDHGVERAVLSTICQYGSDAFYDVADIIGLSSFTEPSNQGIFKCLESVLEDKNTIDIPTIIAKAEQLKLTRLVCESKEDIEYIRALFSFPASPDNIRAHAKKLAKLEITREARRKHLEAYEAYEKSEKDKKKEKEAPISGASKSEKTKEDFKKAGTALLTKDFEQEVTEVKEVKIEKISNDLIDTVPSEVKETASAAENLDNAFKVLKTASLGDLPMEAHVKLKKSFYEQEMQRILSGFPSTEDEGIELPIVVHYPIDEIKKGFMGMIIDTCKGSGKIKFVSSDKEDLHSDWFPADVLKAALMAKIFNL